MPAKAKKSKKGSTPIRYKLLVLLIVLAFIIFIGCSKSIKVNTKSSQEYKKDINELSEIIDKVNITFLRPDLFCQITMSEEPNDEVVKEILLRTKEFVTLKNMNEISKSINWDLEISTVHLTINTDDDKDNEHEYFAKYFKTFDASNKSEENIEAYNTWYENEN